MNADTGNPAWAALLAFATAPAVVDNSTGYGLVIDATGWEALGCFAVNVEFFRAEVLCDLAVSDASSSPLTFPARIKRDAGKKSFMSFCPVTCGCLETPTLPGCPEDRNNVCELGFHGRCRDLSDTALAVLNELLSNRWNPGDHKYSLTVFLTRSPEPRLSSAASVRNGARVRVYPQTCAGIDAAACTALAFDHQARRRVPFWKHPCPVACGVCNVTY